MAFNGEGSSSNSVQKLEELFMEGIYPDKKMRLELSVELDMEPRQIKIWFKNRFLSAENKRKREENNALRMENARLRCENFQIFQQLNDRPKCSDPTHHVIHNILDENSMLDAEIEIMAGLVGPMLGYHVQLNLELRLGADDDDDDGKNKDEDQLDLELRLRPPQSPADSLKYKPSD